MNHFDFITDIRSNKANLIEDNEEHYKPFMVNRGLSYYRDTLIQAQMMNLLPELDNKLQHDYYFYGVRKTNNYKMKWAKTVKDEEISEIMRYFNYNQSKAIEISKILNKSQVEHIHRVMSE
jgi:hypothetical protein